MTKAAQSDRGRRLILGGGVTFLYGIANWLPSVGRWQENKGCSNASMYIFTTMADLFIYSAKRSINRLQLHRAFILIHARISFDLRDHENIEELCESYILFPSSHETRTVLAWHLCTKLCHADSALEAAHLIVLLAMSGRMLSDVCILTHQSYPCSLNPLPRHSKAHLNGIGSFAQIFGP